MLWSGCIQRGSHLLDPLQLQKRTVSARSSALNTKIQTIKIENENMFKKAKREHLIITNSALVSSDPPIVVRKDRNEAWSLI